MYIQSVQLENLKAFKSLNFSLQRPDGRLAGWTVFVGGNASGKSTLLKAVALALMGPEAGRQLLGPTVGWIRQGEKRAACVVDVAGDTEVDQFKKTGRTTSHFEAGVRWVAVAENETPDFRAIDKRNARGTRIQTADRGPWDPNSAGWFSAGYGPMRRLSGSSPDSIRYAVSQGVVSRYVTLFREDAALSESEEWLRKTHSRTLERDRENGDRSGWKELLTGVTELMSDGLLPHGMKISRITVDHVFVTNEQGLELPMRDISDGCRGVYATILDLLHGMFEVYGEPGLFGKNSQGQIIVTRPGVVLIDEIEAHLHPAWQREIPEWLKIHFPNVQFLVATHSPLIAQAADPNGIFLLPLQDEIDREPRPLSDEEYQKIRLGSAHKTVLGIAFGLKTNRSRWADQQIKRWQLLEAKKRVADLTPAEDREYSRLFRQMEFAFDEENILATPH